MIETTIPVVNAATNQTIQEIPAQIAQVELTDPITATGEPLTYVNTVLYANLPSTVSSILTRGRKAN